MIIANIKKKKGASFIEIIIALSIIGIISVAIFNNIAFSLKANKEINRTQNSRIITQHVFEEIKNMGDDRFKEFVKSMANPEDESLKKEFLGDEFNEISKRHKFQEKEEKPNSFLVFNKENTEFYVKVSLTNLDKNSKGAGLVNEYGTTVGQIFVEEWKTLNDCQVGMKITKQPVGDLYKVQFYEDGKPGDYFQGTKAQLVPKVSLEGKDLKVYFKNKEIFSKTITGLEVNTYIRDNTGGNIFYIFSNHESLGLNLYLEQNASNSDFITYGSNIRVYRNKKSKTPYGENITTKSVCKFSVEIYKKDGDKFKKMLELEGHKKFTRFEL